MRLVDLRHAVVFACLAIALLAACNSSPPSPAAEAEHLGSSEEALGTLILGDA
jgi:hypothetical protein